MDPHGYFRSVNVVAHVSACIVEKLRDGGYAKIDIALSPINANNPLFKCA